MRASNFTTNFNVIVNVFKVEPSSLTYVIILFSTHIYLKGQSSFLPMIVL
jgi:hypothetical protein